MKITPEISVLISGVISSEQMPPGLFFLPAKKQKSKKEKAIHGPGMQKNKSFLLSKSPYEY
ncbi:hypothetical protein EFR54_10170 [Lactobacillus delbrueckii subsp. lactis]|nr:hypothetical protein [Lactobacillus delbrueckii subsp. lactis]